MSIIKLTSLQEKMVKIRDKKNIMVIIKEKELSVRLCDQGVIKLPVYIIKNIFKTLFILFI